MADCAICGKPIEWSQAIEVMDDGSPLHKACFFLPPEMEAAWEEEYYLRKYGREDA